jgi:hypothetical protein
MRKHFASIPVALAALMVQLASQGIRPAAAPTPPPSA